MEKEKNPGPTFIADNLSFDMISAEFWLNIFKSSPLPIAVFDFSDNSNSLLFANDAYCWLLGVSEGDIANKTVSEIFPAKSIHLKDDVTSGLIESFQKAAESGVPDKIKNVELSVHYQDRAVPEKFHFDIEHTPIYEEGVVKYVSQSLLQYKQAPDNSLYDDFIQ